MQEVNGVEAACDILIVGGGTGGTAAALAAAEAGAQVCLLEETDWLGGQLTTQGVCTPDEQQYIETFGGTRRYYQFRQAVRRYYRTHYRLTPEAAARPYLNPGNCWVSRLSFEPKVGMAILREMVRPLEETGRLRIFYRTRAVACEMDAETGNTVVAVLARSEDGAERRFLPRYVLDATDLGDLLALCGTEGADWVVGAESWAETSEPDAPEAARPDWVQPFTFPFALDWSPETADTNRIAPPEDYEELKALQNYSVLCGAITGLFAGNMPWWRYRRVLAAENFDDPRIPSDLAMINTAGNDYYGANILGADAGGPEQVAATLARARRASLGYLYWLQTECPREDDPTGQRRGYPEFRLRRDVFDTPDGCSIRPYIRESRRIRSLRPILEQEIVVRDFRGNVCRGEQARAAFMPDSVGVGHYALDIHPNGHGEPNAYVATRPFQIPLGALIPRRLENLLPACKNLGTTHLSNGAYRLHPIEWNIGESAGLLAAFCLRTDRMPRAVYGDAAAQRELQGLLLDEGIPLYWFVDVPLEHPAFAAVQKLALTGVAAGSESDLLFHPEEAVAAEDWRAWREAAGGRGPATFTGTRAEAAQLLMPGR
ncbi:MAG TPA: FAD-dependent oxidoreductase [Chthonomonadaceae bacterium]|nr:FAD-dependent oxidoreductase [Chthonomonadaceae bacterium]